MPSVLRSTLACFGTAACFAATACGGGTATGAAPWSSGHPDPASMHFADAQGLCAITVRYPNGAPGEIDYKGDQYIQRSRSDGRAASGPVVARSGDWTIYQPGAGVLLLVTASASFEYRSGSKCGSNAAPPT
jgi:hypothetical protein